MLQTDDAIYSQNMHLVCTQDKAVLRLRFWIFPFLLIYVAWHCCTAF